MKNVLLLLAGLSVPAAAHTVTARFVTPQGTFTKAVSAAEGSQARFVGQVEGRRMILVAVVVRKDGVLSLEYQAELSSLDGSRSIQVQSAVGLPAGGAIAAADCGAWSLELALDGKPKGGAASKGAWDGGTARNRRVTADVETSRERRRCRAAYIPGSQTNIVDGGADGTRRYGFILNLMPSWKNGAEHVEYQMESSPRGGGTVQGLGNVDLPLGRRGASRGDGYKIAWLMEGEPPPAAPVPAAAAPAAASPDSTGAVPLLR